MPIQPLVARGCKGTVTLLPEYVPGLRDIDGFSHITLVYHFHKVRGYELAVTPFIDTEQRGIFSCRAPKRPNAIGLSTVKLVGIEENVLQVEDVDILDGTPLLDIKPFFGRFDDRDGTRNGWMEKKGEIPAGEMRSDGRFGE